MERHSRSCCSVENVLGVFLCVTSKERCGSTRDVFLGRVRCALTCVQHVAGRKERHGLMAFVFGSIELWMPFTRHDFVVSTSLERHKASDRSSRELHGEACRDKCGDGDNSFDGCSAP